MYSDVMSVFVIHYNSLICVAVSDEGATLSEEERLRQKTLAKLFWSMEADVESSSTDEVQDQDESEVQEQDESEVQEQDESEVQDQDESEVQDQDESEVQDQDESEVQEQDESEVQEQDESDSEGSGDDDCEDDEMYEEMHVPDNEEEEMEENDGGNVSHCQEASGMEEGIREPCSSNCRRKCTYKISAEQRNKTFKAYSKLTYKEKKSYVYNLIKKLQPTTIRQVSRRNATLRYHLEDEMGNRHQVCKTMFLSTLGYHPKNDRLIVTLCSGDSSVEPPEERRGKHAGKKMDLSKIYQHIESFHPTISHYRRSHAPNRRYLPSDITIKSMYDDFKQNNRCSYETYRKAINNLNIGFTKLGEEECEVCLRHNIHMKQHEVVSTAGGGCETCQKWEVHHYHAIRGREHYRMDAEKEEEVHSVVRSVDLQKVIMLPRMPGVKTAVFTRRISAFHETFATVGKMSSKEKRAMSVIWHEGIAGRSAVEVTSAYVTCLSLEGVQHVTYWVDNCTSQNKNWVLISTLVKIVNSDQNTITDITLKFFEPGHTFMSADSFHASVERMMKKRPGGVVLDFQEFRDVIASSNSGRVNVVELQSSNILAWTDDHSAAKMKNEAHLADMAVIQVRRGSRRFFYKLEHDAEDFTGCDFLKTKATLDFPPQLRPGDKGVEKEKKREIISKLVPLMPESRRQFWVALAEEE
ncbi:hypothetical protein ACEWY4_001877 [Coilia grayii]|uniref:Uncharacterized protein n=1 Tax=Coilia grayii TaxID=363190 RepID=A0ABD1KU60_9TELE